MEVRALPEYHVLFIFTKYGSIEEVKAKAIEELTAHFARSNELHRSGPVVMAGTFREGNAEESVSTMDVFFRRGKQQESLPMETHSY